MKKLFFFLFGFLMLVAVPVSAAVFQVGEVYEQKEAVLLDDLYIVGGSVDVSGDVGGDVIVAGGDLSVLGDVSQDAVAVGGSVDLNGNVGDDARVAGGNVTIASVITDDLVAAGGFVKMLSEARVGGDAVIAAGTAIVNGTVVGDLTVYGEEVTLNGPVNGNVKLNFTKQVTLGPDARIAGDLTYSADEELVIPEGVFVGGEVKRVDAPISRTPFDKDAFNKFFGFLILGKLIIALITGVLAVLIFKGFSGSMGKGGREHFWKNALIGFIGLIIIPVIVFLLFASLLGTYIALLLLCSYLLFLGIAKVYAGILAGALLSKWVQKEAIVDWKWAIIGIVVLQLIAFIPVIGLITVFVVGMASFGTLLMLAYKKFWAAR